MLKELQNWVKEAEKVKEVNISKDKLREVDLEGFKEHIGSIFECDGDLYARSQKSPSEWLKTKVLEVSTEETDVVQGLIEQNQRLADWCQNFKKYMDKKLKELESRQDEVLKEVKEYVDHKTHNFRGNQK